MSITYAHQGEVPQHAEQSPQTGKGLSPFPSPFGLNMLKIYFDKNVLSVRSLFLVSIVKSPVSELTVRFGIRVKELRKSCGFTQEELAERVEVSKDYIGLIERGLRSPSLHVIEKIASSLGVTILVLFNETPNEEKK